jgi:hypothetical protein
MVQSGTRIVILLGSHGTQSLEHIVCAKLSGLQQALSISQKRKNGVGMLFREYI